MRGRIEAAVRGRIEAVDRERFEAAYRGQIEAAADPSPSPSLWTLSLSQIWLQGSSRQRQTKEEEVMTWWRKRMKGRRSGGKGGELRIRQAAAVREADSRSDDGSFMSCIGKSSISKPLIFICDCEIAL